MKKNSLLVMALPMNGFLPNEMLQKMYEYLILKLKLNITHVATGTGDEFQTPEQMLTEFEPSPKWLIDSRLNMLIPQCEAFGLICRKDSEAKVKDIKNISSARLRNELLQSIRNTYEQMNGPSATMLVSTNYIRANALLAAWKGVNAWEKPLVRPGDFALWNENTGTTTIITEFQTPEVFFGTRIIDGHPREVILA